MAEKEAVIVGGARTAIGSFGGSLRDVGVVDVAVVAMKGALERTGAVERDLGLDRSKLNVNGGEIAMGHPAGMSGARLPLELLHSLKERGGRYGLASICGNGGDGGAIVVEASGD